MNFVQSKIAKKNFALNLSKLYNNFPENIWKKVNFEEHSLALILQCNYS